MKAGHVLVAVLACAAKLLALPAGAHGMQGKPLIEARQASARLQNGRGVWDQVPAPRRPFVMGAAYEVATAPA